MKISSRKPAASSDSAERSTSMRIFNWEKTCDLSSEHLERPHAVSPHAVSLTSKWTSVTVGAAKKYRPAFRRIQIVNGRASIRTHGPWHGVGSVLSPVHREFPTDVWYYGDSARTNTGPGLPSRRDFLRRAFLFSWSNRLIFHCDRRPAHSAHNLSTVDWSDDQGRQRQIPR